MNADRPGDRGSDGSRTAAPGLLRAAAQIAVVAGAAASVAFTIYAGRRNPSHLLIAAFVIWVLSPFVALMVADARARRWPGLGRVVLPGVMLAVSVISVAVYGSRAFGPPRPQGAFVFVVVPPLSWLLSAVALAISALMSRTRS